MRELNKCIFDEIERMQTTWDTIHASEPTSTMEPPAPRFVMIMVRMIFCSLAGMYPHSRCIPSSITRRELYRQYMYTVPTIDEFKTWIMRSKRLMTIILRENHIFNLESMPGLEKVFRDLYKYNEIKEITLVAMSDTTKIIDNGVNNVIDTVHYQTGTFAKRTDALAYCSEFFNLNMPLSMGTMSNIGDIILGLSLYYASTTSMTHSQRIFALLFWKSTTYRNFVNSLDGFDITGTIDEVENAMRVIVIYWMIVRDACTDQSMKKYCQKYETCVAESLAKDDRFLLPEFPPGKGPLDPKKSAKSARSCNNSHKLALYLATRAEKLLLSNVTCRKHRGGRDRWKEAMQCDCIIKVIMNAAESFDVYNMLDPDSGKSNPVVAKRGVEQYLWDMYNSCLQYCYRPRQTTFAEEIVSSMVSVCNVFDSVQGIKGELKSKYDSVECIYERFHAEHGLFKVERGEIRSKIENVVNTLGNEMSISYEWLSVTFKVNMEVIKALDKAETAMLNESNHRCPYNTVFNIARYYPRDFWIVRMFFKILHRADSTKVYNLSHDIATKQIEALHRHYNYVLPGHALPATAGSVYYCPYHKKILAPLVGIDVGDNGYINTGAVGVENVIVNPRTNEKYCNVKTGRVKRRCVHDDEDPMEMIRRLPRRIRKLFEPVAEEVPADDEEEAVNSDDVVSETGEGPSASSARSTILDFCNDGGVDDEQEDDDDEDESNNDESGTDEEEEEDTAASNPSASSSGAKKGEKPRKRRSKRRNYGRCTREPAKRINLIGKLFFLGKTAYMLCTYCGHPMRYGRNKCTEIGWWCGDCVGGEREMAKALNIVWDTTNNCADPMHIPPTVHGVNVWKEHVPSCMFCNRYPSGTRHLHYILAYNDVFEDMPIGLCYMPLCSGCCKWWIGKNVAAMRLSNIFYNLTNIKRAITEGGQIHSVTPKSIEMDGEKTTSVPQLYGDILENQSVIKLRKQRTRKVGKRKRSTSSQSRKRAKKDKDAEDAIEAAIMYYQNTSIVEPDNAEGDIVVD
jgi:hypothetical protein